MITIALATYIPRLTENHSMNFLVLSSKNIGWDA